MSEPTSTFPATLEWDDQPQPGVWVIPPPRQRWWLYALFLVLTLFSTMVVGARMQFNFVHRQSVFSLNDASLSLFPIVWIAQQPARLLLGLPFSLTLMFILFAHEMGHYLYARHYHVYATPPFFVPFPSLIGTLGAFIRIKSPIPSRAALFDIGIAGPIAGFIPACIALVYGLSISHPIARAAASEIQPAAGRPTRRRPHRIFHFAPPASLDLVAHHRCARSARILFLDRMVPLDRDAGHNLAASARSPLSRCHGPAQRTGPVRRADAGPNVRARTVHAQFRSRSVATDPRREPRHVA